MRQGRPRSIRIKKSFKRAKWGTVSKGAKNPKQISATVGRRRKRRRG